MMEAGHDFGFPLESVAEFGIGGDVVVHDLDHHLPIQIQLAGQKDLAHAPFAQEANDLIPTQENTADHRLKPWAACFRALPTLLCGLHVLAGPESRTPICDCAVPSLLCHTQ